MAFYLIGDENTVLGYQFAGVSGAVVDAQPEALAAFGQAVECQQSKILLITDQVATYIEEEIIAHRLKATPPYVVIVSSIWGEKIERKNLETVIQEAVGIKIGK